MADVILTIGDGAGDDYASLAAAFTGEEGTSGSPRELDVEGDRLIFQIAAGFWDESTPISVDPANWGFDATNYILITAETAHQGVFAEATGGIRNTSLHNNSTIAVDTAAGIGLVQVDGVQFDAHRTAGSGTSGSFENIHIRNLIARYNIDSGVTGVVNVVRGRYSGTTVEVFNLLAYAHPDSDLPDQWSAFWRSGGTAVIEADRCTIIGGQPDTGADNIQYRCCDISARDGDDYPDSASGSTHNASSDLTAPGSNPQTEASITRADVPNEDYTPTAGDIVDAGTDVGIAEDIRGVSIPQGAAPDIGAFEVDGGGGGSEETSELLDDLTLTDSISQDLSVTRDGDGDEFDLTEDLTYRVVTQLNRFLSDELTLSEDLTTSVIQHATVIVQRALNDNLSLTENLTLETTGELVQDELDALIRSAVVTALKAHSLQIVRVHPVRRYE